MMIQRIQILPEKLCNQIAAGEVVERPSSVVKELVENSLDAGADNIVVEVERGGKKRIVVSDNGCGMGRDDVFLCFERHATSKIKTEKDLFNLQFHGFRGEALPSIAAVSRLVLTSRNADDEHGVKLTLVGGKVTDSCPVGMAVGTTFEIKDLFFNLPARRKFLRRDETEFGHIAEVITRIALAHPSVRFKLIHNGRTTLELYKNKDCFDRVVAVLGRSVVPELLGVDSRDNSLCLKGYLLRPEITRSATNGIYCFVNGRFVKDKVLHHAIMDGYRHLLMKGRYPVCVLFLTLDPAKVDVNVHPTKHEVRFHDQQDVHRFVSSTIREQLRRCNDHKQNYTGEQRSTKHQDTMALDKSSVVPIVSEDDKQIQQSLEGNDQGCAPAETNYEGRSAVLEKAQQYVPSVRIESGASPQSFVAQLPLAPGGYFSQLTILGQYNRSYIVCESESELVLVDQHAAHERIGFERLKKQYTIGLVERQELLFPAVIELSLRQDTELRQYLEQVQRLGFDIHPFGGTSWSVTAIPFYVDESDVKTIICDVLAELENVGTSVSSQDAFDAVLIKMACHGMIRANQKLDLVEMEALLKQLDEVDFNRHCPHGRPILQKLTLHTIEKMFRRV